MRYLIYEGNMERLTKKIVSIRNKCAKYGCDFHFEEVGEEFKDFVTEYGEKYTLRYVAVEADGTAIVNGWQFIASVEHTNGGNIIKAVCDVEIPQRYYTSAPICEHCHSNRTRKDTYLVRNVETGEFKQVGKTCLRDFTNGMSAEAAAAYISLYDELICGTVPDGEHMERYYRVDEFLRYAAETIRHFGYVKRDPNNTMVRTTRDRARDYYMVEHGWILSTKILDGLRKEMENVSFDSESDEAEKETEMALAWIKEQPESNTFLHNLKTICSLKYTTEKNLGILAALFPAYERDMAYHQEQKRKDLEESGSRFIGEIKQRITVSIQSVECITSWEGAYGITRVYKITDTNGNVFTWKTNNTIGNTAKTVTGTVKAHTEYRGVKQTEITRCKVA